MLSNINICSGFLIFVQACEVGVLPLNLVPDATPEHGKAPSAAAVSAQPINPSSTPSSTAGTQKPTESSPAHDQKPTAVPIAPTVKPDNHPETKQPGTVVPTISNNTPPASTAGKTEKTDQSTKEGTTVPTAAPTTPKPAQSTTASSTAKPTETSDAPLQARGFDGASFIGGIILTLGLLAIGFMGFKYYKNQTERNYHTL